MIRKGRALRYFFLALRFLTIIPVPKGEDPWPEDLGISAAFYPLIGGLIGGMLWGTWVLLGSRTPPGVKAFLLLAVWVISTGALHVDGFLDTCDGVFGGMTPERRLEIMHDVHYGSFALAGGALLFIGKYAGLTSMTSPALLLLPPVLGRWGMVLSIWAFPYARREGLGGKVKEGVNVWVLFIAFASSLAFATFFGWRGAAVWGVGSAFALTLAKYVSVKLGGGLTGDVYGAICEVIELVVLLGVVFCRC